MIVCYIGVTFTAVISIAHANFYNTASGVGKKTRVVEHLFSSILLFDIILCIPTSDC